MVAFASTAAASFVEFVEASTVVLAVCATGGWIAGLAGAAAAASVLGAALFAAGNAVLHLPLRPIRLVFGALLLAVGLRWLLKATRRAAGVLPRRDEAASFRRRTAGLEGAAGSALVMVAFGAVAVEGVEVVLITVAVARGGEGLLVPAMSGAILAFALVVLAAAVFRGPLTRIPENTLKRIAGVLLSAYGLNWLAEAAGIAIPAGAAALGFAAATLLGADRLARHQRSKAV